MLRDEFLAISACILTTAPLVAQGIVGHRMAIGLRGVPLICPM
ncbi:MAG: hypothetical protein AB8B63_17990 [Granulosicoccus sp.]